ncbi:MAG TPA: adenylate/guanylate cyclase domain-containing protein [Thermohalobaculum sp.]|nr:adenylate/guanylate cyclase domain-containing protein [Thermohalobaculum sp.]
MERRLAAILAADVVGYTRLMGEDEAGTLRRLTSLREDVIQPLIAAHRGRIVKLMGDGFLVKFASVVDSVACAVAWQQAVAERRGPEDALRFRIGINLGDVIVEGSDIHGDGVNIAARLEALAEPGGICLSGDAFRHAKGKVEAGFEDMGEHDLKNVAEPVRVYRVTGGQFAGPAISAPAAAPDKPSIAVLPFTNTSGDPEHEAFSDGISEDIITELSRFRTLFVIARNSSFAFKGAAVGLAEIGRKLGVQYVVEGSVRRAGNRVRISAQLVETGTGNHIWAERYDRDLEDIFAVQDEVTRSIVAVLPGRVQEHVVTLASRKPTENMKAYELMLRAKSLRDSLNAEDTLKARQLLERAIELDPSYARAHMYLADTYVVDLWLGLGGPEASGKSLQLSRRGAALDNNDAYIQDQLGFAYLCEGMWEDAEAQFEKTLGKIVNEAESMAWCGYGFLLLGQHRKAQEVVLESLRLDPLHPPALDWILGQVHYFARNYEGTVQALLGEALLNSLAHAFLAAAYAQLGREDQARGALQGFIAARRREFDSRNIPAGGDSIAALAGSYRQMWRDRADWDHLVDGLRKAGLPE